MQRPLRERLREVSLPALVACAGLTVTAGAYRASRAQRERELGDNFAYRVRDAQRRIEIRLGQYEQILLSAKGFMLDGEPSRAAFRQFVEASRVQQRYPGIQGVGYSVYLPKALKAAHETAVRAEGFQDYAVRPPHDRDVYTAIVFLEPLTGRNLRAFGFDMYSEAVRRKALDLAWSLDDTTISGKVTLVQETDKDVQAGFLMYVPLFREKPTRSLQGWVYAPFRMNDFMAGVLGEREGDLEIEIHDGEGVSPETRMFGSGLNEPVAGHLEAHEKLTFAHHTWTLHVHPRPALAARLGADRSPLVALSGVGATSLLALLTWTLNQSRARAVALATEKDDLYRRLLRDVKEAVLVVGRDGSIRDANPQASVHYGYSREELCRMTILDLYPPAEHARVRARLQRLFAAEHEQFETTYLRKDGSTVDSEVSTNRVEIGGEAVLMSFVHDITERKRAEAQLAELNRSLEERIREAVEELRAKDQLLVTQSRHAAMGEMLANIAHQWRQPLNALSLLLANLQDAKVYGELDDATLETVVNDANKLIQKMSATITDFREFFRPQKEKREFSALEQVEAVRALVGASFERAGIHTRVEVERDVHLYGYPNEYSQVLLNLLANAKDAMGERGGDLLIGLSERDGLGCLTVRDQGGGIPDAVMDKIFEPYFSTKPMGTGIGLYMSKQIIERNMGGRLELRNVQGGAEIAVLAPLATSSAPKQDVRPRSVASVA